MLTYDVEKNALKVDVLLLVSDGVLQVYKKAPGIEIHVVEYDVTEETGITDENGNDCDLIMYGKEGINV